MIETLLQRYPDQVNLIFVHRPFPNIHPQAIAAAEASEIAAAQGKFWPMYDALYAHQKTLEPSTFVQCAAQIGLDPQQFRAALNAHEGQAKVDAASKFWTPSMSDSRRRWSCMITSGGR